MSALTFSDAGNTVDLYIFNGDISLNNEFSPIRIEDQAAIVQDIKHLILELGVLRELIGERDVEQRRLLLNRLEREVEEDIRLVPGTIEITETEIDTLWLQAETYLFGQIGFGAGLPALSGDDAFLNNFLQVFGESGVDYFSQNPLQPAIDQYGELL